MTIEAPGQDLIAIQMLRGIAAMMVVFVHLDVQLARLGYATLGSNWLTSGVDIFFVISGFIMWTSVERRPGLSARDFLKNRVVRIVPLYWLVTATIFGVAIVAPAILQTTVLEPGHVISSFLFAPARHPVTGLFWPLLIPGWSINYEMLFYLIFGLAIALSGGSSKLRFLYLVSMILAVVLIGTATRGYVDVMNFYASPLLFEFVAGVMLGIVWRLNILPQSLHWLGILAAGFLLLWIGTHTYPTFFIVASGAVLVVAGSVFLPPAPANAISYLGDASYSLYLTHPFSLAAATIGVANLPWRLPPWLYISSTVAFAVIVAVAVYLCLERPMTRALKRKRPRMTEPGERQAELG